jgi:hypothetical protein
MMKAIAVLLPLLVLQPALAQTFTISGTMQHTTLEGGCWYLDGSSGQRYELIGDPEIINPLHEEGKFVNVEVEAAKGAATICMMGDIVRVVRQVPIQRAPYDPPYGDILVDGIMKRMSDGTWYIERKKHHVRYEFQKLPPKSIRQVGKHVRKTFHIILDTRSTKHKMDGLILPERPSVKTKKMIEKKYDAR